MTMKQVHIEKVEITFKPAIDIGGGNTMRESVTAEINGNYGIGWFSYGCAATADRKADVAKVLDGLASMLRRNSGTVAGNGLTPDFEWDETAKAQAYDLAKPIIAQYAAALQEIGAGNLDGETQEQFAERCVRVAKEALRL